ncbi:hypothetical protein Leryth_010466, partial [Lithospermum erythrorhizon]
MELYGGFDESESFDEQKSGFGVKNMAFLPPWAHGKNLKNPRNGKFNNVQDDGFQIGFVEMKSLDGLVENYGNNVEEQFVENSRESIELLDKDESFDAETNEGCKISKGSVNKFENVSSQVVDWGNDDLDNVVGEPKGVKKQGNGSSEVKEVNESPSSVFEKYRLLDVQSKGGRLLGKSSLDGDKEFGSVEVSRGSVDSSRLPWTRGSAGVRGDSSAGIDSSRMPWNRGSDGIMSNTELAEKLIPEPELKRLRNVALRMVERIKVGAAGVTQALVDSIHEKWRHDEIVKLKFEGPPATNMKRTHEFLESRTGGLVIWRSGSSVVLFRGLTYKLPCVQLYTKENEASMSTPESSGYIGNGVTRSRIDKIKWLATLIQQVLRDTNLSLEELQ